MEELDLYFDGGTIEGAGRDSDGRFTFTGSYDGAGRVRMFKQYPGRQQVLYEGHYDEEGTITGGWSIGTLASGTFALAPDCGWVSPDASIEPL
jgi:hypothetical protein